MANWEVLQVDTNTMSPGRFYTVHTDSNATTLLTPMENNDPVIIHFEKMSYISETINQHDIISIWTVEDYKGSKKHTDITSLVDWYIIEEDSVFKLIAHFKEQLTGYIKLK